MEGDNGEDVDEEDDHAGNCDRTGKVPHRVLGRSLMKKLFPCDHLHLLNDEVEVVPPCVREETGVEGQGDARGVGDGVLPCEVLCPTVAKLDKPGHKQQWSISRKERATLTL